MGDLPEGKISPDELDDIDKRARLTCPHRFMINALGIDRFAGIVELSVLLCVQNSDQAVVSVSVSIDVKSEDE